MTTIARLLHTNLRWFLLAMILANIAGQMTSSLMSLYLIELGASVGQVGLIFTLASLLPLALQILGGWLSDTIGRLRAIALGSTVACLGYLVFVLAPSWEWVLLGLSLEYVSGAFVGPSFRAYVADESPDEQRGRVFGLTDSLFMIVMVIGPALAGFLAYRYSFRLMLAVGATLYFLATGVRLWMAIAVRFTPRRAATRPTWSGLKGQMAAMFGLLLAGGLLTWIWVTDAVGDTAFTLIRQLYPIYLADIGGLHVAQIGVLHSAWGAAVIVSALLAGWLVDRYSERAVIAGGFLVQAAGLVVLLQAGTYPAFLAAGFVFGLGAGGLMPAYSSLTSKAVPEDRRGLAFGFFGTSLGILSLPFPWIGAQLWERLNPQAPFWIAIAACLLSIPIVWRKFILPQAQVAED
jgi:MFS family permease